MSNSRTRLLVALGALGLSVGAAEVKAAPPSYGSFGELAAYFSAAWSGDLKAKLDFVRSYPKSQVAQTIVREIAVELNSMAPAEREAAMAEIEATGGIPAEALGAAAGANAGSSGVAGAGPATAPGAMTGRSVAAALESIATSSTSRGPSMY
ncbi:MAG TPA: hypothetical protein ENJ38_09715 [Rhodospirillales bacterium]|nr:hypothetical protein [Rhodospirillales bacterium]